MKGMNRVSAPGPDGFGSSFYSAAWQMVSRDFMQFLDAFHADVVQMDSVNTSFMELTPKTLDAALSTHSDPFASKVAV